MRGVNRFGPAWLVAYAITILHVVPLGAQPSQVADSTALIGEWRGRWTHNQIAAMSDSTYITIKKVEGDKVSGTSWITGPNRQYHNRDLDTKGSIVLVKDGPVRLELDAGGFASFTLSLVSGNKLEGELKGASGTARVELTKTK
jgi:hypothetical protein